MKPSVSTVVLAMLALGLLADGIRQRTRPVPPLDDLSTAADPRPELARMVRITSLYKQTLASRQARFARQLDAGTRLPGIDDALMWESFHPVEPSRNAPRLEPDDY